MFRVCSEDDKNDLIQKDDIRQFWKRCFILCFAHTNLATTEHLFLENSLSLILLHMFVDKRLSLGKKFIRFTSKACLCLIFSQMPKLLERCTIMCVRTVSIDNLLWSRNWVQG